ncbi:RimJ/RimL family protein N-acetyltransferase [Melghirimyces profundicolus]|uniref:RimJ/RimL family protein N-acetyltransferase n=1 Tax=Melghirimyces profundicolus TaxID=1242148 RepID=A0A2T6C7Q5_9BACL|nr:GNAT family protein [Melghirimyces profundicolus]PTX64354.1 RimJ/RimL family protein N-acetyltransferase [Melghirimyces profundicolus]
MLTLRKLTTADFPRLIEWTDSPEFLLQWAGPRFHFPLDEAQLAGHLKGNEGKNAERINFKAIEEASGEMVGHVELNRIDREHRSATLARVLLDPARRGGGLGTAMVREAVRYAFGELDLHRLDLYVFDFNRSAIRSYERAGFRWEGTMRDARKMGDEYWNLCIMSLLQPEWNP